jgi:hypothetical protein
MVETNLVALAIKTYQRLLPELNSKQPQEIISQLQPEPWNLAPLVQLPTVGQTLHSINPVPCHSILIGACEDGLPFLLDLAQPAAGPLLVTGDAGCGKTRQLKVMVESALRLASPREIQIGVVTGRPEEWSDLFDPYKRIKHSMGVVTWEGPALVNLIDSLVTLAEDRYKGRRGGTAVILIVEDLSQIQGVDNRDQMAFHWLLQNGPQVGIWVIASLQAELAVALPFWVDVFRTRLFGKIDSGEVGQRLAIYPGLETSHLITGSEFCTRLGKEWMSYWVPELGD